jgi:hypothetical protein
MMHFFELHIRTGIITDDPDVADCSAVKCACALIRNMQKFAASHEWLFTIRKATKEDLAAFSRSMSVQPRIQEGEANAVVETSSLCAQPKLQEFLIEMP